MKKLLLSLAAVCMAAAVNAQSKTWNFTDMYADAKEFEDPDDASKKVFANYEAITEIDGLKLYPKTGDKPKAIKVDASNKTIGDVSYTKRLKLGGTGNVEADKEANFVEFAVSGTCSVSVSFAHGGSGGDRTLMISSFDGTTTTQIEGTAVAAGQTAVAEVDYTGGATKIRVYSASSGLNLYAISVTYGTPVAGIEASDVVDVEYYNVAGVKVAEPVKGINIVKKTLSNGGVETSKVFVK